MEASDLSALSSKQVAAMSLAQIEAITAEKMSALTYDKIIGWSAAQKKAFISPLVLDLTKDGIQTLATSSGVTFDVNNDGVKERTGWIAPHDALLVRDLNRDGRINHGGELFGEGTRLPNGRLAKTGYEALAALDSQLDGIIDKHDVAFSSLLVWRDKNSNGIADAGELTKLTDAGITSLSLKSQAATTVDNGNLIGLMGSFTTADGRSHTMADVWFSNDRTANTSLTKNTAVLATEKSVTNETSPLANAKTLPTLTLRLDDVLSSAVDTPIHAALDAALNSSDDVGVCESALSSMPTNQHSQLLEQEKLQTLWGNWL
jgi:hypothetical protein